jgi:hypothetical protein
MVRTPHRSLEPKMTTGCSSIVATAIGIVDIGEMPPEVIRFIWSVRSRIIILLASLVRETTFQHTIWNIPRSFSQSA